MAEASDNLDRGTGSLWANDLTEELRETAKAINEHPGTAADQAWIDAVAVDWSDDESLSRARQQSPAADSSPDAAQDDAPSR